MVLSMKYYHTVFIGMYEVVLMYVQIHTASFLKDGLQSTEYRVHTRGAQK